MAEDRSILALVKTLDRQIEKAEANLHDAQQKLLHVRTEYAAARETLDRIAETMGFRRTPTQEYPDVSGGGVPYPALTEEALRGNDTGPNRTITPADL